MPTNRHDDSLADDILPGADAIAAYTGFGVRAIYHMLETGSLPGRKLKGTWIGSKRVLRVPHHAVQHRAVQHHHQRRHRDEQSLRTDADTDDASSSGSC
jgi:hypothetical protein